MKSGRAWVRETAIFAAFALLTAAMTWPWVTHVRDHASDTGDPYLTSWILWWDFHQTFHDPIHLFDGNIFFPYRYSLAFSENGYGLAVPFFPLFALGVRPLTVNGLATLLGFTLSGYGAFRLARTLTGSAGAGWISGIAFAFVPYRFGQIPHVFYVSAGWMALLLEAAVLFARDRSRKRAAWLAAAFFMNGLSVIHWFVLALLPLALTFLFLAIREGIELESALWRRGAAAIGLAGAALLPFLLPYERVKVLYGFERDQAEAGAYSARWADWLTAEPRNRPWAGFGAEPTPPERALFPGVLLFLLPAAALLLAARDDAPQRPLGDPERKAASRGPLLLLDAVAVAAATVAVLASGAAPFRVKISGHEILRASTPARAMAVLLVVLAVRWWLAYPGWMIWVRGANLRQTLRLSRRPEFIGVGLIWALTGFAGSFGMNGPLHAALFDLVPLFRGIRVPARWAMVCYLGLAVLAGAGALALAVRLSTRRGVRATFFFVAAFALLLEMRAAPLDLIRGAADPDELALYLKKLPMRGGLVELPSGKRYANHEHVLRAADHGRPLVDAVSGFPVPTVTRLEDLCSLRPIPDELFGFLESLPVSYVSVHETWLEPGERAALNSFLGRGVSTDRLRYIRSFTDRGRVDLYAVLRNEPGARAEMPFSLSESAGTGLTAGRQEDVTLTGGLGHPFEGTTVTGPLDVDGWARIEGEDLAVTILIDGEPRSPRSFVHVQRPDVEALLPRLGSCKTCGFEAVFDPLPGDRGPHEIVVVFRDRLGRVRHYPVRRFFWEP